MTRYFVHREGQVVGVIYAPNYTEGLKRAAMEYGLDIELEEA